MNLGINNPLGEPPVDWTPIALIAFALLIVAELLVFRTITHNTDSRILNGIINGLSWVFAAALFLSGLVWIAFS